MPLHFRKSRSPSIKVARFQSSARMEPKLISTNPDILIETCRTGSSKRQPLANDSSTTYSTLVLIYIAPEYKDLSHIMEKKSYERIVTNRESMWGFCWFRILSCLQQHSSRTWDWLHHFPFCVIPLSNQWQRPLFSFPIPFLLRSFHSLPKWSNLSSSCASSTWVHLILTTLKTNNQVVLSATYCYSPATLDELQTLISKTVVSNQAECEQLCNNDDKVDSIFFFNPRTIWLVNASF